MCYEYANTFAQLLNQEFNISTRLVSGNRINNQEIRAEEHQWLDYWNPDPGVKQWIECDPTGSAASPATSGSMLDNDVPPPVDREDPSANGVNLFDLNSTSSDAYKNEGDIHQKQTANIKDGFLRMLREDEPTLLFGEDPIFLQRLSSRFQKLGLFESNATITQRYTAENSGQLDVRRALAKNPNCYKVRNLTDTPKPKGLFLYHPADSTKWQNPRLNTYVPIPLLPVINQLIALGIPVHTISRDQLKSSHAIKRSDAIDTCFGDPHGKSDQVVDLTTEEGLHLLDQETTNRFFSQLAQVYYLTAVEHLMHQNNRSGTADVDMVAYQSIIFQSLLNVTMHPADFLPITVPVGDHSIQFTVDDFDECTQDLLTRGKTQSNYFDATYALIYSSFYLVQHEMAGWIMNNSTVTKENVWEHLIIRAAANESTAPLAGILKNALKASTEQLDNDEALKLLIKEASKLEIRDFIEGLKHLKNDLAQQFIWGLPDEYLITI